MPCPYHHNLCAYPEWRADRCEYCHASWEKITLPAVAPGYGYGDKPLSHLWRHATDWARADAKARAEAARKAARRRAA